MPQYVAILLLQSRKKLMNRRLRQLLDKFFFQHSYFGAFSREVSILYFYVQRLSNFYFLVNICGHTSRKGYWNSTLIVADYIYAQFGYNPHRKYRKPGNRRLRMDGQTDFIHYGLIWGEIYKGEGV